MLLWGPDCWGLLGGVEEGGRADGGKGVMQLWATASTFAPMEKNCLWPPPKVSPLRRRAGKDPGGRLLVCMQPVSRQQLKTSLRQKTDILSNSIIVNGNNSFLHFLELLSVYTHFFFSPTLLCPSHPATWLVWQRYTKWRRGAESCKAESGSHFLTDPGPGTERESRFSMSSGQLTSHPECFLCMCTNDYVGFCFFV